MFYVEIEHEDLDITVYLDIQNERVTIDKPQSELVYPLKDYKTFYADTDSTVYRVANNLIMIMWLGGYTLLQIGTLIEPVDRIRSRISSVHEFKPIGMWWTHPYDDNKHGFYKIIKLEKKD